MKRAPLPAEAYPRGRGHEHMLSREWTRDASWEIGASDLARFGRLAEELHALAVRTADRVLGEDRELDRLELGLASARMRRARARGDEAILARLDFALEPDGHGRLQPWLLELNGDTPGNVVEGGLLQPEWGRASGLATAGDRIEEAVASALRELPGPLTFLHHTGDPYIASLARYLESIVPDARRVEYPAIPETLEGSVYKMFRWGRLWTGRFPEVGAWAERRDVRIHEPAWSVLLQHKGLLAAMWRDAAGAPGLLPATLEGPSALPDGGKTGWAEKTFHGVAGSEVTLADAGTEAPPVRSGLVWQRRVSVAPVDGRYPILCALLVKGRFAGAVLREDDKLVSVDDIVAPIAVVDERGGEE